MPSSARRSLKDIVPNGLAPLERKILLKTAVFNKSYSPTTQGRGGFARGMINY